MAVFRDPSRLSPYYVPPKMRHREKELSTMMSLLLPTLERPHIGTPVRLQVTGGVGSGKTTLCLKTGERMEQEAAARGLNLKHLYVNLKLHGGGRVTLYRHLAKSVAQELYSASLSAEELLQNIVVYLKRENRHVLITLDEVDYYVKHTQNKEPIVYDFTRLPELGGGKPVNVIGVVFTARTADYKRLLERAEVSTLGQLVVSLKPYSSEELVDILGERVEEAFMPSSVSMEVLEYVADITAREPINGDMRYALDLLTYAGNLAEAHQQDRVLLDDVRAVISQLHHSITTEDILHLGDKGRLVLLSLARALRSSKAAYVGLREVRETCELLCEELNRPRVKDVEEQLQDLSDRGIVDIRSLTRVGISGVAVETLDRFLDGLVKRLEL